MDVTNKCPHCQNTTDQVKAGLTGAAGGLTNPRQNNLFGFYHRGHRERREKLCCRIILGVFCVQDFSVSAEKDTRIKIGCCEKRRNRL